MRSALWVGLLGLVLAAPVASAELGTVHLSAELPIEAAGVTTTEGTGRFLVQGDEGRFGMKLTGETGTLTRVQHRAYSQLHTDDPWADVNMDDEIERIPLALDGAYVTLSTSLNTARLDTFQFLAWDADISTTSTKAPQLLGRGEEPLDVVNPVEPALGFYLSPPKSDPFMYTIPGGMLESRATAGRTTLTGDFRIFIADAVLQYVRGSDTLALPVHLRVEERDGSIYDPIHREWIAPGTHKEIIEEYVVMTVSGILEIEFDGIAGTLYSDHQAMAVKGQAKLPDAKGAIELRDGSRHDVRGEDLTLAGRFNLDYTQSGSPGRVNANGDGDFTTVAYGKTVATYDWATMAAAVGLGAVLLAIGAWIAAHKGLLPLGGAAVAGYARVHGQDVLEHAARRDLYARVQGNPGVSFLELSGQVAFADSTLQYHLRVLEKNEFIACLREGRNLRYFDRQDPRYARDRRAASATLRNGTTAAIVGHILRNPGIAQRDLAEAFEITASTVHWHIQRLSAVGLVATQREHPHTRYYMGQTWTQLPADEQARVNVPTPVVA